MTIVNILLIILLSVSSVVILVVGSICTYFGIKNYREDLKEQREARKAIYQHGDVEGPHCTWEREMRERAAKDWDRINALEVTKVNIKNAKTPSDLFK